LTNKQITDKIEYHPKGGFYMKAITNLFSRMFKSYNDEMLNIHREWDRQRARSMSPAETAEIDAIFSRHV
jgi:hypothetical protein